MQTENTLRMARNSLLCFFMALATGFLVACGGGGGGGVDNGGGVVSTFPAYLVDAPVEGAEYSGPTRPVKDVTGKDGEFEASEGVFEFSVGATTLGSVRLSSSSAVTPADFIGVDTDAKAITIARIMQALDFDGDPQNGISISQSAREGLTVDLFARLTVTGAISVTLGGVNLTIPPADDAEAHFVATRRCLFSGGYAGSYRTTLAPYEGQLDEGQSYFALEPFANRIRGVEFSNVYPGENDMALVSIAIDVGAIGSTITLSPGNELSFVTPRLITGIWTYSDESEAESGTNRFNRVAGNPGATRRVVGVETDDSTVAIGLYAIDYFADDGSFRGQYYDVRGEENSPLFLTIAGGGSWPAAAGMTTTLTLSGTLGGDDTAVTVEVVRKDENYGSFEGGVGTQVLSGTWCDIGGATGVAVPPPRMPPAPRASAQSDTEILVTWSAVSGATSYNLYRSTSSGGTYTQVGGGDISDALRYLDRGRSADTEYFYRLEACNSSGCSRLSPAVSVTTTSQQPQVPSGTPFQSTATGTCTEGRVLSESSGSCTWGGITFSVGDDDDGDLAFLTRGPGIRGSTGGDYVIMRSSIFGRTPVLTFIARRSGNTWRIDELE